MCLRLLILQRDVERQDESVLNTLRHIRVPCSVVHDQTPNKLRVGIRLVLHLHDFNHVQINWVDPTVGSGFSRLNSKDGVDNIG